MERSKITVPKKLEILEWMFGHARIVVLERNEFILQEGEICNRAFYVKEGVVRHFVNNEKGTNQVIQISKESDFFYGSVVSHFTNEISYIYCQALTNTKLYCWDKNVLEELSQFSESLAQFIKLQQQKFIILKHQRELSLLTKTAEGRYKEFTERNRELFNRIPHYIIASYLNMSPEVLSRLRTKCIH